MDSLRHIAPRGFTLVEMLVVLTIIVAVTIIAIMGQTTFNRSLLLTDTAYTLAFSIREAQSLGLSSRVRDSIVYNAGYGIRFSSLTPTSYLLFADTYPGGDGEDYGNPTECPGHTQPAGTPEAHPGNCLYDQSATPTELVRTYTLNRGFKVASFCGTRSSGNSVECSTDISDPIQTLHISFMRPSTDTVLFGVRSGGARVSLRDATIRLTSPDDVADRCVTVSKVGQIAVTACDE